MYVTMWILFLVFSVMAGYLLRLTYQAYKTSRPFQAIETRLMVFSILVSAVSAGYIWITKTYIATPTILFPN